MRATSKLSTITWRRSSRQIEVPTWGIQTPVKARRSIRSIPSVSISFPEKATHFQQRAGYVALRIRRAYAFYGHDRSLSDREDERCGWGLASTRSAHPADLADSLQFVGPPGEWGVSV